MSLNVEKYMQLCNFVMLRPLHLLGYLLTNKDNFYCNRPKRPRNNLHDMSLFLLFNKMFQIRVD